MVRVFHSEKYPLILPSGHRFPFEKYGMVREQLEREGFNQQNRFLSPVFLEDEEIHLTHCRSYWSKAKTGSLSEKEYRKIGFPNSPLLVDRSLSSASGTFRAGQNALKHGAGMNLAGGTHHAYHDKGEGFCLLNDVAIASNILLKKELVKKILICDLDVHQGNGTASIFQSNDNVFTMSVHCEQNYPFKKEMSDLDLPLMTGSTDKTYLNLLEDHFPALLDSIKPDIVFYVAGVDILEDDRLGKLKISKTGCKKRDDFIITNCNKRSIPMVGVMGGGYNKSLKTLIDAHTYTFKKMISTYE